jgi:hypothetical protein
MINLFKKKLPDCDYLFKKYLSPWYPEGDRPTMTRPDMYIIAGFEGQPINLEEFQYLPEKLLGEVKKQIQTMTSAVLEDYQKNIQSDKLDLSFLDSIDKFNNRQRIKEILKVSDPSDFSNLYLVSVCEFGATLGHLYNELEGYGWLYSYPYFHSIIVHTETGFGITVFDWAVKKFSEYGVDDGYLAKFHVSLETINQHKDQNKKNGA